MASEHNAELPSRETDQVMSYEKCTRLTYSPSQHCVSFSISDRLLGKDDDVITDDNDDGKDSIIVYFQFGF